MPVQKEAYQALSAELESRGVTLVAVSKTKPLEDLMELYELGQRDFGENYVQELVDKQAALPKDIRWHFIGHLQTNKVKYIIPFVYLIHGVDSLRLLREIDRQSLRHHRVTDVLLQVHIAREESKFGLNEEELGELEASLATEPLKGVRLRGFMGMASFSDEETIVREEFKGLNRLFRETKLSEDFNILSMGMSGDYRLALDEGSGMVRIGSLLFGARK